jgi:hypothetical protein
MGVPIVVMPDAELVAVTALRAFLAGRSEAYTQGVTVCTQLTPGVAPSKIVRVRRKGGKAANVVTDTARLDILIWHDNAADRMALGQLVRGFLVAMVGVFADVPCYGGVEFMTPQAMPDPDDDTREIVMLTVDVSMRGTQLS